MREDLRRREERYLMRTYARSGVEFVRGEGAILFDEDGREYLDLLCGIAVTSMGHSHPELVAAATDQMGRLDHVSNLFFSEPMVDLAERLSEGSLGGRVFFCNSGTEANECAIKVARKHAHGRGISEPTVVTFTGGFHGRTYGSLSATPTMAADPSLGPMLPGFEAADPQSPESLSDLVGESTAAIMIETIRGEGGVFPVPDEILLLARELADRVGALLIFDEVQTGVGRTGTLWSFEQTPVRPDLFTSSKALGGGFPIGACVTSPGCSEVLEPGDHGSTFAAGPVAAAVAGRMLDLVDDPTTLKRVTDLGDRFSRDLARIDGVAEVRGRGLMIGIGLASGIDARMVRDHLLEAGVIVNAPRPDTVRLLPPFILTDEQAGIAVEAISEAIEETRQPA